MQQMCELSQGVWIVYLTCLSLIDIRTRKIPIWLLSAGGVMAIVMQIWKSLKGASISPILIVSGATVGIVFLGISKITREAFGYGDGIVILILGICLGLWDLLIVLMISFLGASLIAILLLVWNKGAKKQSMPFIPFLCIGYVAVILMG